MHTAFVGTIWFVIPYVLRIRAPTKLYGAEKADGANGTPKIAPFSELWPNLIPCKDMFSLVLYLQTSIFPTARNAYARCVIK